MKKIGAFLKKNFVLVICIVLALAALGAGIWFLANPGEPETPNADPGTTENSESDGELELEGDMGFGNLDSDSGSGLLPDGNTSSGSVTINPDGSVSSGSGSGNTSSNPGTGDTSSSTGDENQTIEVSGSVIENPF